MKRAPALPPLAAGAALIGVLAATLVEGYHPAFAGAFGVALLWRLLLGRDGRRLLPRRVLAGVLATLLAVGVTLVLTTASLVGARPPLAPLLEMLSALATVALLARLDAFGSFWLVLLSSTLVAGTCYVARGSASLVLVPVYVAWLAATLVVLERVVGEERRVDRADGTRVLVDPGSSLPRAMTHTIAWLVRAGFVAGFAAWLLMPRPAFPSREGSGPAAGPGGFRSATADGTPLPSFPRGDLAISGPDETADGVVLGTVGKIQEDNTVHFEVRLVSGDGGPTILLREDVMDTWEDDPDPRHTRWRSTTAARQQRRAPGTDGWLALERPSRTDPVRDLAITLRANRQRVFLEPDALRFRVRRPASVDEDGGATGPYAPIAAAYTLKGNGQIRSGVPLLRGDVVDQRSMPQPRGGGALLGNLSDAEVSPLPAYVAIDPALAARLKALSADVRDVGVRDPWRRARALEQWLQSPRFTYELASPALAPGRRVEDFLARVRRGNCEWFATALTLLLRAHGMPARYVRGYWGGSHTKETDLWTFYGTHYHAWCELYLDGAGWVPLNPTPPERLAEGADPKTRESGRRDVAEDGPESEAGGASGLRRWVSRTFQRWVSEPLSRAFGPDGWVLIAVLVAVVAAALFLWRRRRSEGSGAPGAPPGPAAAGPYADALRLLARRGLGRRREWTAREHLAKTRPLLPAEGAGAFERLTGLHEAVRYAGRQTQPAAGRADLAVLERVLRSAP